MERVRRHYRFSASDVVNAVACAHLAAQDQRAALGMIDRPERHEPMLDLSIKYGFAHEKRFLDDLHAMGLRIGVIEPDRSDDRTLYTDAADTLKLMDSGHFDVIYQGTIAGTTRSGAVEVVGHADFFFYDYDEKLWKVADTKLARHVKTGVAVQLPFYNEALREINGGRVADEMYVVLGNGNIEVMRTADYGAYSRAAIERTEEIILGGPADLYPEKNDRCGVCAWFDDCSATWVKADDLNLVRRMIPHHRRKLMAQGVDTVAKLAALEPQVRVAKRETPIRIAGVSQFSLERLTQQARLQVEHRETGEHKVEFVDPPEIGRGLYRVREPQRGDLYFDLEVNPFIGDGGFLYLAVVAEPQFDAKSGQPRFDPEQGTPMLQEHVFVAPRPEDELALFNELMEYFAAHFERYPEAAIHHWGHFDQDELIRQAGKHGVHDEELDAMISEGRLVDLYSVFDQGIRFSGKSYGLKKVEHLFSDATREVEIDDGAVSVQWHDEYLEVLDAGDTQTAERLWGELVRYCTADVVSLPNGHQWLWRRRVELMEKLQQENRRPRRPKAEVPAFLQFSDIAKAEFKLRRELNRNRPIDLDRASDDELARVRMRELIYWHRREARPEYADYRRRREMDGAELVDDSASIGELEYLGVVDNVKRSHVHRYAFDATQEYRIKVGDQPIDPATEKSAGTVVGIGTNPLAPNGKTGWIDVSRDRHSHKEHPTAIIPDGPVNSVELRHALVQLGQHVRDNGATRGGRYSWGLDLLMRRPPHFTDGIRSGALVRADENPVDAAVRLSRDLDRSFMVVQGPPGTGKSFTGAAIVRDAVARGQRVFVLVSTHASGTNFVNEIDDQATREGEDFAILQRTRVGKARSDRDRVHASEDRKDAMARLDERNDDGSWRYPVVVGTLHGLGARLALDGEKFDLLVADEAGQQSLANVLSGSGLARNGVLLGDQQQLPQVTRAAHPLGMGASSLEHYLDGHDTIPRDRGVFLDETRRCHPQITRFISDLFYEDKLGADPGAARQRISGDGTVGGVGLAAEPVHHSGNRMRSDEEAAVVADLVLDALQRTWTDRNGVERPLTPADIMVVTPFNAQLAALRDALV
ncbi:MAG: TM0106 family RecB-like putative nuclease, partial [Acidimicrobiia bacterium]